MSKPKIITVKKTLLIVSRVLAIIMAIVFGVLVVGSEIAYDNADTVSAFLDQNFVNLIKNEPEDGEEEVEAVDFYTSEFDSVADVKNAGIDMTERVMAEGAVLLYNKDNALPLDKTSDKVSLFSVSSANPVWSGARESHEKEASSAKIDFKKGLENAGLTVNDDLYNWYKSSGYGRKRLGTNVGIYEVWSINEAPWSAIDGSKTKAGFNTAVFVISRIAGEGFDTAMRDLGEDSDKTDRTNGNYLLLSPDEKDVFDHIKQEKAKGTFDKFIVLMNTTNQVAVDFVDKYDVDAVLYCGSIGSAGANAVGKILTGEVNPSGKLSDTFWKNHYLNPVLTNWGQMSYNPGATMLNQYIGFTYGDSGRYEDGYTVYQEGIYSGYRYTETRYEDVVMGTDKAGDFEYYDAVAYPFGYGLSYTDFKYDNMNVAYSADTDEYSITVDVTNVGSVAGKTAVQLFLQKPYTEYDRAHGVEKAAVEFVAFDKTDKLEPGAKQTVTLKLARRELASYDSYEAGTYILEQGNYYLTIASDAHAAVNNILAKKGFDGADAQGDTGLAYLINDIAEADFLKYSTAKTGKEIVNVFDDADLKLYDGAGSNKDAFHYMTRADWAGTVKYAFDLNTAAFLNNYVHLIKTSEMAEDYDAEVVGDSGAYPTYGSTATSWQLIDLRVDENGDPLPFDHERWGELLDQLTFDDMANMLMNGFAQTKPLVSISNPGTYDYDSDLGVINAYSAGSTGLANKINDPDKHQKPPLYLDNGIVAATRNPELCYEYGVQWGEDCLWAGYQGLYGTGANIHRSPYLGRTYGYFSEDPVLTGRCVAQMNLGMESKGSYMLLKHCVLNEQECNRCGGASWANEQSIREIYLKAFAVAIDEGGVQGVMTALTRLGAVPAPHHPFINEVLRGEFNMQGYCVTDSYMGYMNIASCVLAGNDLPLSQDDRLRNYKSGYSKVAWAMRDSVHNILYSVVHSSAMNGFTSDVRVIIFEPEWQYYLKKVTPWITAATWVCIAFFVGMEVWSYFGKKKNNKKDKSGGDDGDGSGGDSGDAEPTVEPSPDTDVPLDPSDIPKSESV